jgi:M6 family metalloprotease-like protein
MLYTNNLQAVPASPYPVEYALPDGTNITITLKGDEFTSWAETEDGYTILKNPQGFFEYAVKDAKGDLVLSGITAKNALFRSNNDSLFLQNINKRLKYSKEQAKMFNQLSRSREEMVRQNVQKLQGQNAPAQTTATGTVRAPLILVQFPNKPFTRTAAEFQMLCNQLNYTQTADGAITGSVRDYFKASSYNQLDFQVDVYGPFMMSQNISAYNQDLGDPAAMVVEAANAANAAGCNFAQYDINNDGNVDAVHIIFAGYGQENGYPASAQNSIWSHRYWIFQNLTIDGKRVYDYSCSPELRDASGSRITHIGVIAHELSHVFGLPDLYDTDYEKSGGTSIDLGKWDIMASGSWNNDGKTPAFHSAWCKIQLGWVSEEVLSTSRVVHLPNPAPSMANPATDTLVCRINTQTDGEYFLTENRQKQGWDAGIPASGMLIYHVDENYIYPNYYSINANPSHRGLYVKQAGCNVNSNCADRTTDPYPYSSNNQFTDTSTPNSKSWAGQNTLKPITGITHNTSAKTITFNFTATPLPNDASLSSLSVNQGTLNPNFRANTLNYDVVVANSVNNITISATASNPNATISGTGNKTLNNDNNPFDIVVTAEDGTTQLTYNVVVNRVPVGLEETEVNSIKLYPNPVENELRIKNYELQEGETARITDISGKTVMICELQVMDNEVIINVSSLANGIYFIKIGNQTAKFIKK